MGRIVERRGERVKAGVTRRDFIKTTALAAGAMAAPLYIPARLVRGTDSVNGRIRVGQIGAGRIATAHDMPGVFKAGGKNPMADLVAICDVDAKRAAAGKAFLEGLYRDRGGMATPEIAVYGKYEEMLARKDIDAVVISLPDHQHAQACVAAIRAGKDVYMQKPFTLTHEESVLVRDVVVKSGRIFQIGSQQRSWGGEDQFRKACEFVRNGRVGNLKAVEIGLPADPTAPNDPQQPVPMHLDYDRWLGPAAEAYYTEQRVHSQKSLEDRPGWFRNESFCMGMICGWGAHHLDTAHWGMDMELSGPMKAEGTAEFPPADRIWNVHGAFRVEMQYPKNIKMTVCDKFPTGLKFIGDEGWIFVSRDGVTTTSDPKTAATTLKYLDASDPKLIEPGKMKVELPVSAEHHLNWLEAVKAQKPTNVAPAPIAHRSNSACLVAWIAMKTGRPLTWDVAGEKFVNDAGANALLSRPERAGYGAVRLSKM